MLRSLCAFALLLATAATASADILELDFFGNAGFGLLPGNEIGDPTPVSPGAEPSFASGGEVGDGLLFNTETNVLAFDFEFSGLTGGLLDAASGIHLHRASADDPLNTTGPIVFNLNSFSDPSVINAPTNSPLLAGTADNPIGVTEGRVTGLAQLTSEEATELLNGQYYLNIHSAAFGAGELRGNLVVAGAAQVVPEPTALVIAGMSVLGLVARRRR